MKIKEKIKEWFSDKITTSYPLGIKIKKITRPDGSAYLCADDNYTGQQCPFCGSHRYGGGGSWSPDGCLDCNAIYHMGWIKEL